MLYREGQKSYLDGMIGRHFLKDKKQPIQANLRDIMDLFPDHCNKANTAIMRVTHIF